MYRLLTKPTKTQLRVCRIAILMLMVVLSFAPRQVLAHQTPGTIVLLDILPGKVAMELQIPLAELELAFGHNVSKNPETLVKRLDVQLKEYLLKHIHPTTVDGKPWTVEVTDMKLEKAVQVASGPPFQEVTVHLNLNPPKGANVRKFILNYDVIMHQVVTHSALVSVRNDWETGKTGEQVEEVGAIRVDTRTALI